MSGINYRLDEFIPPEDRRSLLVDTSAGLALGALPGLEAFTPGVRPALQHADGVVCSPGQLRRLEPRTRGQAGVLARMDWTNTLRGQDFVLQPEQARRVSVLSAQDARALGACGMVASFLLGYEEEIEAASLLATVQLALAGKDLGLPLVVEVCPTGPRITLYGKAVELAVSYALEGGADVIVFPNPGPASLETIAAFASVPWLMKAGSLETAQADLETALAAGGAGLWLDHTVFARPGLAEHLGALHARLHSAEVR